MAHTEGGRHTLEIPLDASGIEGLKPDQPVKVIAVSRDLPIASEIVKLDAKGHAVARLALPERPGAIRVALGPADATDQELAGLQTINVNVAPRRWAGQATLKLSAIRIHPYYWSWWFRWCRTFTIHGVVRCPDGTPVPGATVCAYDVDWFWWWASKQLITCDTTDANGAFELKFKWCCGWWPWWWWKLRHWVLEPALVDRIGPVIQRDPRLARIAPGVEPSFSGFEALLTESGMPPEPTPAQLDPAALSAVRERLLKKLAPSPELERLRIWPWYPWHPWWDCTPDVIFKVTQECHGKVEVLVNETVFDTRFNIATTTNVTLVAGSEACCAPPPNDCPAGECLAITEVCQNVVDTIAGNQGAPPAPAALTGYQTPGAISPFGDRPYGEDISISGTADCLSGVDYYEIQWTTTPANAASWAAVPPAALGDVQRTYLEFSPFGFHHPVFSAQMPIDGHHVYETLAHYEADPANVPADWLSDDRLWLGSSRDVLTIWRTLNNFGDGLYYLRVKGWNIDGGGHLINPQILKICESQTDTFVVIRVDNRFEGAGPTDAHGNPCGTNTVHLCTNEPDTAIVAVAIKHPDNSETSLSACGNTTVTGDDQLIVDFVAYDPNGHLAMYSLQATYDVNLANPLLALPGAVLEPSPVAVPGVPTAVQVGPSYADARSANPAPHGGASAPVWTGGVIRLTVKATGPGGAFPYTCCYQLELRAHKRTIVNCDQSLWGHVNLSEYSFTIVV